jgi:hypothetical protein
MKTLGSGILLDGGEGGPRAERTPAAPNPPGPSLPPALNQGAVWMPFVAGAGRMPAKQGYSFDF